ncbi:MAG TPA: TetR/AcrR family transcriptional regulator [Polyangiaceae bacterium]|nr:TetR/AcrR family transcriptional regulator [Polyangiaceae bacterium]
MGVQDRKARDFKRREQEILAAALELSQSDQWQAMTIDQIAQAAEIGKGTVYKHFATKEEIFAVLALDFHRSVLEELSQLTEPKFERRVRQVVRVFWERYRAGKQYQRIVQYCERRDFRRAVSKETRQQFEQLDQQFGTVTSELLQLGIKEGLLPKKPLPLLLFGANAALYGGLHLGWGGCMGGKDSEDYLNELTDFILRGWVQKKAK